MCAHKSKDLKSINDNGGEILEGFLCPICMQDLTSVNLLQTHFEAEHATEDKVVLQSLKGFLNKVKKLINEDDNDDQNIERAYIDSLKDPIMEENNPWNWFPAPVAKRRNHSDLFRNIRSKRIDSYVIETNKLLIRLDKIITHVPSDSVKRKAHEKSIVDWVDDSYVSLCPFCASHFNIGRRKHHCRLCGAITCDDCSQFLEFTEARKLIAPIHRGNLPVVNAAEPKGVGGQIGEFLSHIPKLKRSNSHNSLNSLLSMVDSIGKEQSLRICLHCLNCLEYRKRQVIKRNSKNLLSIYYHKLQEYRSNLESLISRFKEISNGLNEGSSSYDLDEAESLRSKILLTSESMSNCSNKIRALGLNGVALEDGNNDETDCSGEPSPASVQQELLQRRIHACSLTFLKEEILGLPKLPTREKLRELKDKRRQDAEARLTIQRQSAAMREAKSSDRLKESPTRSSKVNSEKQRSMESRVLVDSGWVSNTNSHNVTETDDPIVQQMSIIRNYIKEAKSCNRCEEVAILEENLRQLQMEYKRQK